CELGKLRSGSLAAVAIRGAAKASAHSGRSKTGFFIIVAYPFVSFPIECPPSLANVRDELVLPVDLDDRANLHPFGRIATPVVHREHQLLVRGEIAISVDAPPVLDGGDLERFAAVVVEQVGLDVDALPVEDSPEVLLRLLGIGSSRLPFLDAAGHDDPEVLV